MPGGQTSSTLALRNWQAMARRDGDKIVLHHNEAAARAASGSTDAL